MARVKRAVNAQKKRRATLERASGYRGQRSRLYRKAKEQVTHSLVYAYRDRKVRKSDFRKLWIQRINAASREQGLTYNRVVEGGTAVVHEHRRGAGKLQLEDLETAASEDEQAAEAAAAKTGSLPAFSRKRPVRKPFPVHLPRRHAGRPVSNMGDRASASSAARIASMARWSRERTVPGGTPRTSAASSRLNPR